MVLLLKHPKFKIESARTRRLQNNAAGITGTPCTSKISGGGFPSAAPGLLFLGRLTRLSTPGIGSSMYTQKRLLELCLGQKISHSQFGDGVVTRTYLNSSCSGPDLCHARADFAEAGDKIFNVDFLTAW
jgi:hypothetical protein